MVRLRSALPALVVWALSAALYGAYFQAQWAFGARPIFSITGDEPHYLTIATSLVSDGDLDVLDEYRDKEYFPYYPFHLGDGRDMEDMHAIYGRGGGVFSKHSVGLPLVLAPAMRLGGHGAATLVMIAIAAALSAQTWGLARDALPVGSRGVAAPARLAAPCAVWLAWAAVALTPPLLLYAPLFYPEVIGALLTVVGVRALLGYLRRARTSALITVGFVCGVLPWFHLRYAPIAFALGALGLASVVDGWRRGRRRTTDALALTLPAALAAGALLTLNWRLFGGVPPVEEYGAVSLMRLAVGAPGLFFDRQFGLLPYAPAYAVAPFGCAALWRLGARRAATIGLPFLLYAGFVACFSYWYGAFSPPARMLVPVLPLLVAPLAAGFARSLLARVVGLTLLALTAAMAKLLVDVPRLRYNLPTGSSAALEYLSQLWDRDVTAWLPSFIHPEPASYLWTAIALTALVALSLGLTRARLPLR
jgi:hypothetical protein